MHYKAVILIAGPQKGTRFRPLSLDVPKPLFRVAGIPIVQHHIEALAKVEDVSEVLLLGFYPANEMCDFVREMNSIYKNLNIRYLQEYTSLGTAGGLHHFRDQIRSGNPDAFFVLNGDVCADFPLKEMKEFHHKRILDDNSDTPVITMMTTEATRQQSLNYGCVVVDKETHAMRHYVEKPSSYISTLVNCGVYIFGPSIFKHLAAAFEKRQQMLSSNFVDTPDEKDSMYLETDILPTLAGTDQARVFQTTNWWSPVKTAASAIYANRHYLGLYRLRNPERLAGNEMYSNGNGTTNESTSPKMVENVYLHPTATVHPTAVIGPNVSIGANVTIGEGVRLKESIVLEGSVIDCHSIVMHTVIGKDARIGSWTRVEGTPNDPNPNKPYAKMDNNPLFNLDGKLNPSITIVGCNVTIPPEVVLLNSIVLPHKQLSHSIKNEIVL